MKLSTPAFQLLNTLNTSKITHTLITLMKLVQQTSIKTVVERLIFWTEKSATGLR